jgi:hypothetical protein
MAEPELPSNFERLLNLKEPIVIESYCRICGVFVWGFMHVQADIFDAVHIRVSLSVEFWLITQKLPQRGALL